MSLEDRLYPLLPLYERLPQGLKSAAGLCYRSLPRSWRYGVRYAEFQALTEAGEQWSLEEIREYQFRQLRAVLLQAASHSRFYQQRFAQALFRPEEMRSLADFQQCPFLEKKDVQDHADEMVSNGLPAKLRLYMTTGGSTGVPVGFYLQKGVSRPKEQAFLEAMWRRRGWRPGARLAVIRGHVITPGSQGRVASYDATRNWLLMSSSHLTRDRLPDYLEALETFKPDLLHIYPSAALQIAEFLETSGQTWRLPLVALLCGSERLTTPQKRLLQSVFGCPVYRWYGHSERVVLAGEGRTSELLYFWPQYGLVEFGPPDEDGLCEIIGTSFHNHVMPLIRYRTGDYARLADPRTDGDLEFPWPAVSDVAGREHECLVSGTGRRISLTALNMHDAIFDELYAVQFFQPAPGLVEFRYIPRPGFHSSRLEPIEAGLRRKLGEDFRIEFRAVREVEKTPRGKHRWLASPERFVQESTDNRA